MTPVRSGRGSRRTPPPAGTAPPARSWARVSSLAGACAVLLTACGYIGPPLPPALHIPAAVDDFRAIEYGSNLMVQFTPPAMTTDDLPLTDMRALELYIGPAGTPFNAALWAAGATRYALPTTTTGVLRHEIPAQPFIGQVVTIGVRSTGPTGRVSDWSNFDIVDVEPPLPQPAAPVAANVIEGVSLTWSGAAPRYRVMRSVGGGEPGLLADVDMPAYLDQTTVYGTQYSYVVIGLAGTRQQSVPSSAASITPSDTFPPGVPMGLSAVPGPQTVELAWARNTEPDFAGYNLFRSVDGGPFVMIPMLLDAPAYSDADVSAGHRYSYTVSALDASGNMSDRSQPAEVSIP